MKKLFQKFFKKPILLESKELIKERSVFVRIELEDKLPSKNGNYLTTIKYPDGKFLIKKSFYCAGNFKLKAGKKHAKVVNWFKRVVIPEEDYQKMVYPNKKLN